MRSPGQIVSVVLSRDAHLWQWVIHDSTGVWNGFVEVSVTAPLEEASALLASHVARNWDGQELPGAVGAERRELVARRGAAARRGRRPGRLAPGPDA